MLLLGPSGILLVEGHAGETMGDHLRDALQRGHPDVEWTCDNGLLFVGEGMVRRAQALVEKHRPDAVALLLGLPAFADDFVVNRIRRILPPAYPFALRLSVLLKRAAGGRSEGAPGLRGLIFRLPHRLARALFGADPNMDVATAVRCATEAIDALVRIENVTLACRLSFPVPFYQDRLGEHLRRVAEFNAAIAAHCRDRRIPFYDLAPALAESGAAVGFVGDGVHPDRRTQQFDMGTMASYLSQALLLN